MGAPKDPEKRKLWIENLSKSHIGYIQTQEHKDKISIANSGENNPMYSKHAKHKPDCLCSVCKAKRGELKREKHWKWKGEEYLGKDGRWYIWVDEIRYIRSRYVAMKYLGRELKTDECIHHIGVHYPMNSIKNKGDDSPENLYVFASNGKHVTHHKLKITPILISNIL